MSNRLTGLDLFSDTEIAFQNKSDQELKRAYWLFRIIGNNPLTTIGLRLTNFALRIGLPVKGLIRKTIFHQFCGGERIDDCKEVIHNLHACHIGTILDYSVEGDSSEDSFDRACTEIMNTIIYAENNPAIPFTVFKPSGLGNFSLMEKVGAHRELSNREKTLFDKFTDRMKRVCEAAVTRNVRILIDAEHSWIQDITDDFVRGLMKMYNQKRPIVYNTYQLYRHDKLGTLKADIELAKEQGFFLGAKLVRGAYMEMERDRADELNYPSPINETKALTDDCYDAAVLLCLDNLNRVSFMAGTHNEESSALLVSEMEKRKISKSSPSVYFAQLYGMSDHISFNLAHGGYNVAKYLPFGSVTEVMPYLFRRAKENTSVAGQVGRELSLISKEIHRRRAAEKKKESKKIH